MIFYELRFRLLDKRFSLHMLQRLYEIDGYLGPEIL